MQLQTKDQLTRTIKSWTKLGLRKLHTTLGEIIGLHNCAVANKGSIDEYYRELDKAGIRKSRTTLGEIVVLHNCAVANITPQLWNDITPQQRLKCKEMGGGSNVMITYDATKWMALTQMGSSITPHFLIKYL